MNRHTALALWGLETAKVADRFYSVSELIKAVQRYDPSRGIDQLSTMLAERIRIGASASHIGSALSDAGRARKDYTLSKLNSAFAKETEPVRRLLFLNCLLRIELTYPRFIKAIHALHRTPLALADAQASWYALYVMRFSSASAFPGSAWDKSGGHLRKMYHDMLATARHLVQSSCLEGITNPTGPVLLALSEFGDTNHPLAKQMLDIALSLKQDHALEPIIVDCAGPPNLPVGYFSDHTFQTKNARLEGTNTLTYQGESFAFHKNASPVLGQSSLSWFATLVRQLRPRAMLTLGPGNLLADSLAETLPTLALPNIGECPLSGAKHLAMTAMPGPAQKQRIKWASRARPKLSQVAAAHTLPKHGAIPDKAAIGVDDDKRIALIVGMRLQQECTPSFLSALNEAAHSDPNLVFVFLGPVTKPAIWLARTPHVLAQARFLGLQDDVLALTKAADIYINPHRRGGGTSALYAMASGVPVLSAKGGDVAEILGPEHCCDRGAFRTWLQETIGCPERLDRLRRIGAERWARKSDVAAFTEELLDLVLPSQPIRDVKPCPSIVSVTLAH